MSLAAGMMVEGTLYFNRKDINGAPMGIKKVIGITQLELKVSSDIKEQISKDKGNYGAVTATVSVPKPTELSLTIANFDRDSLAMAVMGANTAVSSGGGTVTDEAVTAKLNTFVPLAHRNITAGSVNVTKAAKGTGTGYTSSAAGFAIGTTSIPVITGSGTILEGDKITFAGDTTVYTVATGVTAPGTIVLASPGLVNAIPAAATALTIIEQTYAEGTDYEVNYALGMIEAKATITENLALKVDYAYGAVTGYKVDAGTVTQVKGELILDGRNLADNSAVKINVPSALLTSDSAIDFMSDKFVEFKMKGRAESINGAAAVTIENVTLS